jgi:predicted nucleic acid-binding Zn ribbon protein
MMRIKKCTVCGNEFLSKNGKEVCSIECSLERKRLQDKKGNERRRMGISGQLMDLVCLECGKTFTGLNRKYCSEKCSNEARSKERKHIFSAYYTQNRDAVIKRIIDNRESK